MTKEPKPLRVQANGLEHRVLEWSADGTISRTVLLVHGYMDAAGTWDRVAPALAAAGFRVLAPDMRGFGHGARVPPGSYYHFVDYVFDLADLVDALAPDQQIALVGHSMGGTITTLFSGTFPDRVAHLANIEGVGPPDNPWEVGPLRMRRWIDEVRTLRTRAKTRPTFTRDEALGRLAANHPNVPQEILADRLHHLTHAAEGDAERLAWHMDPLHRTTSPMPFFARLFVEFAKKVTCPVLFVSGGPRGFHPPDEDERLAAFPNVVERHVIEDAGHMVHWTKPDELAARLVSFFT
jgi:pimeloyl-ACP methyl ester carboxylesterase